MRAVGGGPGAVSPRQTRARRRARPAAHGYPTCRRPDTCGPTSRRTAPSCREGSSPDRGRRTPGSQPRVHPRILDPQHDQPAVAGALLGHRALDGDDVAGLGALLDLDDGADQPRIDCRVARGRHPIRSGRNGICASTSSRPYRRPSSAGCNSGTTQSSGCCGVTALPGVCERPGTRALRRHGTPRSRTRRRRLPRS